MKETKLFSFAILTYRKFDDIYDTLDSIFYQDYPSIELIISDDGSDNYFDEIGQIKAFIDENKSKNISNVIYSHSDHNKGTVENINKAISLSNGYYFKTLGCGDCLAENSALSKYAEALNDSEADIVFAKLVGITRDGKIIKHLASCEDDYDYLRSMSPKQLCDRLYQRNCLPAPAWAAKMTLFEKNGLFPNTARLIEDYPYWLILCQRNQSIKFIDDGLVNYIMDGVSSKGTYSKLFINDLIAIYEKHIFPYDKRFGVLQPFYNFLKIWGLNAYMALAEWKGYSHEKKLYKIIIYGVMFIYIRFEKMKMEKKNKASDIV